MSEDPKLVIPVINLELVKPVGLRPRYIIATDRRAGGRREMSSNYELWGEGLVWLTGAVVCLCAAPRVQLFASEDSGWPRNAPWYH